MADKTDTPTVYLATWGNFEAFGTGKTQAREACRLGVKMHVNRTGKNLKPPSDDLIELTELKFGKPMMNWKYL